MVAGERGHLPVIVWSRRRRVLLLLAGLHLWLDAPGMRLQLGAAIRIQLLLLPWEARGIVLKAVRRVAAFTHLPDA